MPKRVAEPGAQRRARLLPSLWSWLGLVLLAFAVMAGAKTAEAAGTPEVAASQPAIGATVAHGAHASVSPGEHGEQPLADPAALECEKDDEDPNGSSAKTAVTVDAHLLSFDDRRAGFQGTEQAPETGRRIVSAGLARGPPVAA